jgi:glycosyltransferase involved in cell wall biosynthesis
VFVHSLADTEDEMFSNKGITRWLRNSYLKSMDSIVSVSPALHNSVLKYFPDHGKLIVCGVRDDLFRPLSEYDREKFRLESNVNVKEVIFSFLGTIGPRKGFDILIKAFTDLAVRFPNWHLWVVGPKSRLENQNMNDADMLDTMNASVQVQNRIKFWGRIDDRQELAHILAASDVFVFPSRKEGFGIAPLEAMAAGVPVIVSRIPGVTDLASIESVTGRYIGINDIDALKTAMIQLGTDALLRHKMGEAAHQRIKENFGWEKHIDEWESLYTSLIDKRKVK